MSIHAANGQDGLALARRHRPDVILTDVSMPGLDGFDLIRALHADEQTRPIPIIVISASVEPERMRLAMDLGAEDFIVKPFTEAQIVRSIRARLEKKALLDELDAFAHTVAHDLKNPIAVLGMRAQLLRSMWDSADDATLLDQSSPSRIMRPGAVAHVDGEALDERRVLLDVVGAPQPRRARRRWCRRSARSACTRTVMAVSFSP